MDTASVVRFQLPLVASAPNDTQDGSKSNLERSSILARLVRFPDASGSKARGKSIVCSDGSGLSAAKPLRRQVTKQTEKAVWLLC